MVRYSPQREAVLDIVLKEDAHLSVDEIFTRARKKFPKISRATVYRNLEQLEEMEQVGRMNGPKNISYFEPKRDVHHHFVCQSCGLIEDIWEPTRQGCRSCVQKKTGHVISNVVSTYLGLCTNCK